MYSQIFSLKDVLKILRLKIIAYNIIYEIIYDWSFISSSNKLKLINAFNIKVKDSMDILNERNLMKKYSTKYNLKNES